MNAWQWFGLACALAAPASVVLIALCSRLNRLDDDADDPKTAHPPSRQCGCPACKPAFED